MASLRQETFARILACASLAQIGYMLLALVPGDEIALTAMAYYISTYLFIVTGAFTILLAIGHSAAGGTPLSSLSNLGARSPVAAVLLVIFVIALAGFPPTAGFSPATLFSSRCCAVIIATWRGSQRFSALPLAWSYLRIAMAGLAAQRGSEHRSPRSFVWRA